MFAVIFVKEGTTKVTTIYYEFNEFNGKQKEYRIAFLSKKRKGGVNLREEGFLGGGYWNKIENESKQLHKYMSITYVYDMPAFQNLL